MSQKTAKTFEDKMNELQELLDWFEGEEVSLSASTKKLQSAMKLITELKKELSDTTQKIEELSQDQNDSSL
ncbi:exodeoxyribonuclease VII small subunit [Candidatus Saccharibacteria bacterium]|jgi:exodeoxyribonuclease VII small subunit|nr:exodeoxyribonuclease VII small subunit [Candidatus Saccharibacteria bacterium]